VYRRTATVQRHGRNVGVISRAPLILRGGKRADTRRSRWSVILTEAVFKERPMSHIDAQDVTRRMQIDFLEWPMLRVTLRQACRLWNAPHDVCEAALLTLVRAEFLFDRDGMFHRPVRAADIEGTDAILGPRSLSASHSGEAQTLG
jgi:hypothetical protein